MKHSHLKRGTSGDSSRYRPLLGLVFALAPATASVWVAAGDREYGDLPLVFLFAAALFPVLFTLASATNHGAVGPEHFRPVALPGAYIGTVMTAPFLYMIVSEESIGSIDSDILSRRNMLISLSMVFGYYFGIILARMLGQSLSSADRREPHSAPLDNLAALAKLRYCGRLLLACALVVKLRQGLATGGIYADAYGARQLEFDNNYSLGILADFMLYAGVICIFSASNILDGKPAARRDLMLVIAALLPSLFLLGSRGEVIAPILIYMWYLSRSTNSPRVLKLSALAIVPVTVFVGVGILRAGRSSARADVGFIETVVWNLSSPVTINSSLTNLFPAFREFYGGSTYWAAIVGQIPSPVQRLLNMRNDDTAALEYRDIIGFTNPNMGFGFSFPSEAYLNFGYSGVLVAGAILGFLFQVAYVAARSSRGLPSVMYPLVIGTLPYLFRSDALAQVKTVLYTFIIIVVVTIVSRSMAKSDGKD